MFATKSESVLDHLLPTNYYCETRDINDTSNTDPVSVYPTAELFEPGVIVAFPAEVPFTAIGIPFGPIDAVVLEVMGVVSIPVDAGRWASTEATHTPPVLTSPTLQHVSFGPSTKTPQ